MSAIDEKKYNEALNYRPDNIKKLFPNSKALIVSGKVIHEAMRRKRAAGKPAMAIAANGRNEWVIEGALRAAHKTGTPLLIEIAKSEASYCPVTLENIAKKVNDIIEKNNFKVVVAVHADHYAVKSDEDLAKAKNHIPKLIEAGITSFAIDASHMHPDQNVFANIELAKLLPEWMSIETEVGEIKGEQGLSSVADANFHIKALNAYGIFPTWIALNNGSVHGLEATGGGIDVELTGSIHKEIERYGVFGAQHGTSGNNYDKLRAIVKNTNTTKANVATALQMTSWGLKVNEYGNAEMDSNKNFIKVSNQGPTDEAWNKMCDIAKQKGWKAGDFKKLNLEADALLKSLPADIQRRMADNVEKFVTTLFTDVFYANDSVNYALDAILEAKSSNIKTFNKVIESKDKWNKKFIRENGKKLLEEQEQVNGNFDD